MNIDGVGVFVVVEIAVVLDGEFEDAVDDVLDVDGVDGAIQVDVGLVGGVVAFFYRAHHPDAAAALEEEEAREAGEE